LSGLPTITSSLTCIGVGWYPNVSDAMLCQDDRLLVEMQATPPGRRTRRISRRNTSVRRTCSITWLATTSSNVPSGYGSPSSTSPWITWIPRARAAGRWSAISSIACVSVGDTRAAIASVIAPRCGPMSRKGPSQRAGSAARSAWRLCSSVAWNTVSRRCRSVIACRSRRGAGGCGSDARRGR